MWLKIKETLTIQQTVSLINGETVGIFNSMITTDDSYNSLKYDLCLGYYMERSGDKTISQTYKRLMQLKNQNPTIVDTADDLLGKIIRNKFNSKWSKQYLALLQEQYNPITDYEHSETITKDNTDTTTFDTTVENSGNRGSKVTTTFSDNSNDKVYGFNSTSPVNTDASSTTSTETSQGLATDNTTNNTEEKTGTDTRSHIADERKNISGRNLTVAELIDKELDMRNRQIFFDIVYEDIDSIATIGVYTYEPDEYNPIKEYILTDLAIDSNGVYLAVNYGADGFARVSVNVEPPLQDKVATENGIVTADSEYYGLRSVNVQVEGEDVKLVPLTVTANKTNYSPASYNADGFSNIYTDIPEKPEYDGEVVIE